jgi:tetratricopeptide (TPR) repeat protein
MMKSFSKKMMCCVIASGCVVGAGVASVAFHGEPTPMFRESAQYTVWLQDLGPALTAAKLQKKDVLIEFSAPEGGPGADAQDGTGFDRQAFGRTMNSSFVLVRMTPSNEMSPAQITAITTCAERLGVGRFPTFVLMDAEGKPYAKSEKTAGTLESYPAEFRQLQQLRERRDLCLKLARSASGSSKAQLLEEALVAVGPYSMTEYTELQREIIELDAGNELGLKGKYEGTVIARQMDSVIQTEVYPLVDHGNYKAAIGRIDRLIGEAKPPADQLQLLLAFKGQLYFSMGDRPQATRVLDAAIAVDPSSASADRARTAKLQLVADMPGRPSSD